MTLEEIANLKLPCADDCHVFLWVTQGFLFEVHALLERWGLRFRTPDLAQGDGGPAYGSAALQLRASRLRDEGITIVRRLEGLRRVLQCSHGRA